MKKIAIFGLPGSGKSTFAEKLGKKLNLPVHHLDTHFYEANWVEKEKEKFLSIQQSLVNEPEWIIEGNAMKSLEMRYAKADTVIYFCFPRLLCLWRVFKRLLFPSKTLQDTPQGCKKTVRWKLLKYLWNFDRDRTKEIDTFQKKYPHVNFLTFRNQADANIFLGK